jgi:hypothetical protein
MNWKDILPWCISEDNATNAAVFSSIRGWRNAQLAASDWTQLPDVALASDKVQAWADYRQQLREMLKQNDDPKLIVFPEPPK